MNAEHVRRHMESRCWTLAKVSPDTVRAWAKRIKNDRDRQIMLLWLRPTHTTEIATQFALTRGRIDQIVNRLLRAIHYAHIQPNLTPADRRFFTPEEPSPPSREQTTSMTP